MEEMHDANFFGFFDDSKDDNVVVYRISAISKSPKHRVTAEFMRGGHLFKRGIASVNPIEGFSSSYAIYLSALNKSAFAEGDITTLYMQSRPHFRKRLPCIESATSIYFCLGSGD